MKTVDKFMKSQESQKEDKNEIMIFTPIKQQQISENFNEILKFNKDITKTFEKPKKSPLFDTPPIPEIQTEIKNFEDH